MAVCIAIRLQAGRQVNQGSIPSRAKSSVLNDAQIGSQIHQDSLLMGTGFMSPVVKRLRSCSSALTTI